MPFALGLRPRSQGIEPDGMTHFIEYSQRVRLKLDLFSPCSDLSPNPYFLTPNSYPLTPIP